MKIKALLSGIALTFALTPGAATATEYVAQLKYGITEGSYSTYAACREAVKDEGGWCVVRRTQRR
ncbi:hypothetical protein [Candidatus Sororendozoicomonas aggregata]|uniref:hypothetical protein n=1 Tax=Candidatus Sororendozoicomonas aggregata TaxID=3073239 RepID=UPI002ED245A0